MACTAARMFASNATLCACEPGFYLSAAINGTCLGLPDGGWQVGSVGASRNQSFYFLTPVLSLDVVRRLTQSQALLLEATIAALLSWLAFCAFARFTGHDPTGNKRLFRARFWVSRLDCIYDTTHWADDQQVLRKRKTELGGTCSVASLILFVGLVTVLLYQAIQRRNIEVHRVKPANAPDLLSFVNDIEFHITTISSMSCSQLVAPSTIAMGTPGSMDFRLLPLSTLLTYNCQNTSQGPSVSLKCNGCRIPPRDHYVSWQFIDLPRQPAAAVGFQFNLTAKQHGDDKHVSSVSGTINSDNFTDDKLKTFRGRDSNVLKIQLFPQTYINHHNLKLLQPLVQDFTQVSILASIGGLYAFSVAIFLCLMAQCEARIKKLRDEDSRMLKILRKRRAQQNWDKVRKFVMYTWGPSNLDPSDRSGKWPESSVMDSLHGSFHKKRKPIRRATSNGNKPKRNPADAGVIDIERVGEMQESSSSRQA
ncbi:uncharacterized protein [Oryza sativa Japonica Group]|uniref:uncharacterized protein isoform X2 n=1 Tax=Oryza sativa subsp. japonica TaxID=39947 RepID=UPI000E1B7BE3|nr:uncharacterized protein LOC112936026 isoform X2 [Oryza sativa Japonica Group]